MISEESVSQAVFEQTSGANQNTTFAKPSEPSPSDPPRQAIEPVTNFTSTTDFREFDQQSRSVEQHRTFKVSSLTDSSNLIEVQKSGSLADLFNTDDTNSLIRSYLTEQLNNEREQLEEGFALDTKVIGGAVSVSTGLSIGYVIWLVRGGLLLGSVLTSLPAWRVIDPLPVLGSINGNENDGEGESLEDLVSDDDDNKKIAESSTDQDRKIEDNDK